MLDGGFIHVGLERFIRDAGGVEHLAADGTTGSEDQGQSNNLVEKREREASADMGTYSIGPLFDVKAVPFDDSSTGTISIPRL